jgi:zinc protease
MNPRLKHAALVVCLSSAVAVQAQSLPKGVEKITSVQGITQYSLPNGMHLLLFPDSSSPKVTVNMTYLVGSRHEGYGETGMAHLLEHLLFIQTKTRTNIKQELVNHGAEMNGSTAWDRTNYFETLSASDENLKWALEMEADRMINTRMEKAILDKEMTVVRNEFEFGENSPERVLFQRVLEAAYAWHNYGKLPIGNRSDIENVPIQRLAAFYQKYYQPDNVVLTIAGKFDNDKTLALAANLFGSIPKPQRVLEQTYTSEPTQDGERSVTLRRVGDVQLLLDLYHVPAASHPDSPAVQVLGGVLGETPNGRLYKALVDNKKTVSADYDFEKLHDPSFIAFYASLRQDQSLDEARQIMNKVIEGLASEPPTKEEVERVKTRLLKQIDLDMANSQGVALDLSEWASMGDWRLLFLNRDRVQAVTPADVQRVAKAYLKESNRTAGIFIPTKNPDRAEIPAAPDITVALKDYKGGPAIEQGEVFDPSPSNIEGRIARTKLAGGMKVVLLPKKTRGATVLARVTIRFGDEKSVFGKAAAATMTANLLNRGTKTKTRQQIQDEFDRLKARTSVTGNSTSASITVETVEANLAPALRLAAEMLRDASFPEEEFEKLRQQRIAAAEANRSEPTALASIEAQRKLNPFVRGDARYNATPDEQIEDLKKVSLEDVKQFHRQYYGASGGELAVVGQFDKAGISQLAAELFGNWKGAGGYTRIVSKYHKSAPVNRAIETPDKQNSYFVGGIAVQMSEDSTDYPALLLANYLTGGSFASRLVHRIRDQEGLSYGVSSNLIVPPTDDHALFIGAAICAPQNAPKVEASYKDELAKIARDGFTASEVADGKKAWHQEQMVGRSEDQELLSILSLRERFDKTLQYDEALDAKVAALTPEQVTSAFRRYIDPANFVYVKAGDFKKAAVFQP